MYIRYKPDALYPDYKTVRLEDKLGEDMPDQKRRIEDRHPGQPLDWSDAQAEQKQSAGAARQGGNTNNIARYRTDYGDPGVMHPDAGGEWVRFADVAAHQSQAAQPSELTIIEETGLAELANRLIAANEEPIAISVQAAVAIRKLLALRAASRLEDSEQYRLQMAAISTAAFGYWTEEEGMKPEYDTVPLRDVAKLYAKYAALHSSQATKVQAVPEGFVLAPHFRGYAHLGIGAYVINHSAKGEPAELVISVATEEEKAGRTVGDSRDNAPDAMLQPEAMAVRLRFENVAGLDALEQQLRFVRSEHFAESPAQEVTQQAAPTAWLATDLDGRGDVAFTKEEAKSRAGEGCTEFFPLYGIAPVTQQAAKAETAELAEGEQPRYIPDSECKQGRCAFQTVSCWDKCRLDDVVKGPTTEQATANTVLGKNGWHVCNAAPTTKGAAATLDQTRTAGAAKGGEDKPNRSNSAPTTSTVSAPDEIRNAALEEAAKLCDAARERWTTAVGTACAVMLADTIRNLRRTTPATPASTADEQKGGAQ
jgi:hypothetical protein